MSLIAPSSEENEKALSRCLTWLGSEGCVWANGVSIVRSKGRGICVMANKAYSSTLSNKVMAIPVRLALSFPAVDRASSSGLIRKGMVNTDALKILRLLRAQVFEDPEERYTALKHLWCPDMLLEALSLALIIHERFVRGDSSFWAHYLSLIPSSPEDMGAAHWPEKDLREALGLAPERGLDDGHGSCHYVLEEFQRKEDFIELAYENVLLPLVEIAKSEGAAAVFPEHACTRANL